MAREEDDYPDEVEERLVNEEYKIWKKEHPLSVWCVSHSSR